MKSKKILITGANSFIGKNFITFSKFRNIKVISLKGQDPEKIDYNEIDIVIHLAAIVHGDNRIPENEYFRINRDLSKSIAVSAKKANVKHFIFFSTIKVYGNFLAGSSPWNEESPCYPVDIYGRSKYEAEKELSGMASPEFIVSIIRTPLVYGPGVKANLLKLIRLIERFPLLPFGNVKNNRHYTYVENLVGYIDRIIETGASGIFLAMDGTPLSTTNLVRILSECLNRKVHLFRLPRNFNRIIKAWGPKFFERLYGSFYLDNTRTKQILKYNPPVSAYEGLKRTISFYLRTKK